MIDQPYKLILLFFGVLLVFKCTPRSLKWVVLLVASYWLYLSCDPRFWWLLPLVTTQAYVLGLVLDSTERPRTRRFLFTAGVILALLPLLKFKYSGFLLHGDPGDLSQLILPLGLSFYSFQAISYLFDVYKRRVPAHRHFGIVALYIAFFPHLLAGPIVKAADLFPQLEAPRVPDDDVKSSGWRLIFFGVFKKFAVANNLELFVSTVCAFPERFHGLPFFLAAALFRYQLYFDFSGYTDIAIGTGRLMGISLPQNFNNPFASTSVSEHWRRWHMSLVSWFRDHVYFPLCRLIPRTWWFAVSGIITLTLVGLWHSPTWGWVLFGIVNGVLIILDSISAPARRRWVARTGLDRWPRVHRVLSVVSTFVVLLIPGIAGMSKTPAEYFSSLRTAFWPERGYLNVEGFRSFFANDQNPLLFCCVIGMIVAVELLNYALTKPNAKAAWLRAPVALRYAGYATVLVVFSVFANLESFSFMYFKF